MLEHFQPMSSLEKRVEYHISYGEHEVRAKSSAAREMVLLAETAVTVRRIKLLAAPSTATIARC